MNASISRWKQATGPQVNYYCGYPDYIKMAPFYLIKLIKICIGRHNETLEFQISHECDIGVDGYTWTSFVPPNQI